MTFIYSLSGLIIITLTAFVFIRYTRIKTEKRLLHTPPPPAWNAILQKTSPLVFRLNSELQHQLYGYMQLFLHRVRFEGCGGQEITDEVRVTIAAQACMLLIGRERRVYPKLKTVLVYPHTYSSGQKGMLGGDNGEGARLGESWDCGVVVLAWNSVIGGARNLQDGHNVTMHEFAHQLDQENAMPGVPILEQGSGYATWARVCAADFEKLCNKTAKGKKDIIDRYGATNPAEFFAVSTETFFEQPRRLKAAHPELFERLQAYYCVDPLLWTEPGSAQHKQGAADEF